MPYIEEIGKPDAAVERGSMAGNPEEWTALRREIIEAFTPGTPINEADLFAGRRSAILQLQDAALERGRHAIIYGERGVGKTSIANIFYRPLHTPTRPIHAIRVNGDRDDSFATLWLKVFRRIKHTEDGRDSWADEAHKGRVTPDDVQVELGSFGPNELPVIIIDEFDTIEDERCKTLMTDTIKALSDYGVNCTVVLVGVAESINELIHGHESISRALVQVPMPRMSQAELADIVTARLRRSAMSIEDDALWRITFFSAGLPFYTHSLGKHAALRAIGAHRRKVNEKDVFEAMKDCMADVDHTVKDSYVRATERIYRKANIFAQVLAACALADPDSLGRYTATSVEAPLSVIMDKPYKTESFVFHLNQLCKQERGRVLRKAGERRTFRFQFIDPLMRPYIVMKSLQDGVITPDALNRFSVSRQRALSI